MDLFCVILLCVGMSAALATCDHPTTTDDDVATNLLIQHLSARVNVLERQGAKQANEIQSLKAEMSQQTSEIESFKEEMSQQASEILSLKAEMSQQASEIQSLKAEMSQQASEIQSLKVEMSSQANEKESLKAEMSQQASEIQSLKAEMSQQASEIQSLKAEMSQQASEIQSLKAEMSQQASEIQSLKAEMSQQASEILSLKAEMSQQQSHIKMLRSKLHAKDKLIQRMFGKVAKPAADDVDIRSGRSEMPSVTEGFQQSQQIEGASGTVKRIIPVENVPVAFYASLTTTILNTQGNLEPIKFDYVDLNKGNAYNPNSGVFVAPVSGIYVYSISLLAQSSEGAPVYIEVNGRLKSKLYLNKFQLEMTSYTMVEELNIGDFVYAEAGFQARFNDHNGRPSATSFSGFLLQRT